MWDAHIHLDFYPKDEILALLNRSLERGTNGALVPGVWLDDPHLEVAWAHDLPSGFLTFSALGLHPMELVKRVLVPYDLEATLEKLEATLHLFEKKLLKDHQRLRAIGEIGFDLHSKTLEPLAKLGIDKVTAQNLQKRAFEFSLQQAIRFQLPVIVHSRNAWALTLQCLQKARVSGLKNVQFHCFSGPKEAVPQLAKEGYFLSFGGVPTWSRAKKNRDAFLATPLENLLIETDGPDLPYEDAQCARPMRHEPEHLRDVLERLAFIRKISPDFLEHKVQENLKRFLGI
jgi:TatD DNase family protein